WPGLRPVTKALRRQLKFAFESDLAIYSAHLPLDLHPEIGNNVLLMHALGVEESEPFFEEKGSLLGRRASADVALSELVAQVEKAVAGPVKTIAAGPTTVRSVGVITGAAGSEIERNLLIAGHYATEIFGVKALAAHLAKEFQLDWEFIDLPTGL
ncbi:MAG: Nif3-like dinuclear metal center hexameric protein, partial [Verrucomicrobia bacterium]